MIMQDVRYALVFLQETKNRRRETVKHVAEQYEISAKFLEQVAGKLRQAGIISGFRGRGGGYRLARQNISMNDILSALGRAPSAISCSLSEDCKGGAMCVEREIEARMVGEMNDAAAKMMVLPA